jgi:hypothetical protein
MTSPSPRKTGAGDTNGSTTRGGPAVRVAAGFPSRLSGKDERMNRFFRRMQRFGKSWSGRRSQGETPHAPQDATSVRAKSSGHRKRTADKWNQ